MEVYWVELYENGKCKLLRISACTFGAGSVFLPFPTYTPCSPFTSSPHSLHASCSPLPLTHSMLPVHLFPSHTPCSPFTSSPHSLHAPCSPLPLTHLPFPSSAQCRGGCFGEWQWRSKPMRPQSSSTCITHCSCVCLHQPPLVDI